MWMFTLAVSSSITSNLPWFQVPLQYCSYSIGLYFHHQTHPQTGIVSALAQPLRSFWSFSLHSSPVACWTSSDLWGSSLSVISFCLFILFMEFSRQEYWCGFPFPSPVDSGETKSGIQPLAAQKPIKKAGLVERKVCFVLDVGKWWGNTGGQIPVQRLTPLHWQPRYGSFYRQTEGAPMQKQHSEPQQSPWNWSSVVWLVSPSLFQVVSLQFQGWFDPISLRTFLGIVAADVIATVWSCS